MLIKPTKNDFNNNKEIIPQYNISKQKYSRKEKILLEEIRENLVDIAISSGDNFQLRVRVERETSRPSPGFPSRNPDCGEMRRDG